MPFEAEFKKRLETILDKYCSTVQIKNFLSSLDENPRKGFVINSDFTSRELVEKELEAKQDNEDLLYYFYSDDNQAGKNLLHQLGAYYILDYSSAYSTYVLSKYLQGNERVLDMCAAPGGKSISLKMRCRDIDLYSCDISRKRAQEISHNFERMRIDGKVFSIDPLQLDKKSLFDCIILDAPCSGSGMIRKERKMADDWSNEKVERLLPIQKNLLEKAYSLLDNGGYLLYSTCSLSIEEDDYQIEAFLKKYKDMYLVETDVTPDVIKTNYGYHMIPGVSKGEGFFFALMKKEGSSRTKSDIRIKKSSPIPGHLIFKNRKETYVTRNLLSEMSDLDYLRCGFKIYDTSEHPKFELDHDFLPACSQYSEIELTREEAVRYMQGEEIRTSSPLKDGIYILTYKGLRISFSKKTGNRLKNYLSKGLRVSCI